MIVNNLFLYGEGNTPNIIVGKYPKSELNSEVSSLFKDSDAFDSLETVQANRYEFWFSSDINFIPYGAPPVFVVDTLGNLTHEGNLLTKKNITVNQNATIVQDVNVGNNLIVNNNITANGILEVKKSANIQEDLTVNRDIYIRGQIFSTFIDGLVSSINGLTASIETLETLKKEVETLKEEIAQLTLKVNQLSAAAASTTDVTVTE